MRFKVSVLRGTKASPGLEEVTTITADRFNSVPSKGLFDSGQGVYFYNDETNWYGKTRTSLVAFLPGTEWIIERV